MKQTTSALLITFVLVTALLVTLFLWSNSSAGIDRSDSAESPKVQRRLEALEASQRSVLERLDRLENPPLERLERDSTRRDSSDEPWTLIEKRMRQLESRISALERAAPPSLDEKPVQERTADLEDDVARALESIRQDEKLARARAEIEKRSDDLEPTVRMWSSWLRLDELQRVRLNDYLQDRVAREREMLQAWEAGEDSKRVEERRREIEREFIRGVRSFLSPEQVDTLNEKFDESAEDDR